MVMAREKYADEAVFLARSFFFWLGENNSAMERL